MKRPGKILIHVTCKAYSTVNADRLPKYNQHRVITDGHSGIPQTVKPGQRRAEIEIVSMHESMKHRCRVTTDKSSHKGA